MIEIQNVTKRFGSLAALEHLNLQIKPGRGKRRDRFPSVRGLQDSDR